MKIHQMSPEEVLQSLQSSLSGLSSAEAQRRLREFGRNRVEKAQSGNLARLLLGEFANFFAMILWFAAGLALWAELQEPGQGMAMLAGAIVAVIIINGLFSFWQMYKAEKALAALEKLLPLQARVLRDGSFVDLPTEMLVPGDILDLQVGNSVSADCRLIEAFGMRLNTATITGESVPQGRSAHANLADDVLHSTNIALAGTTVVSGVGKAVVYGTGMHTEFGKIAQLTQGMETGHFPLQEEMRRLSRLVAVLAAMLGIIFFLIGLWIPLSFWQNFMFAIGIIVANVPEGLLPTVTLALAMGAQRMAKRKVLIRHLPAVETLGAATVICTDKTGTLTENRMTAKKLFIADEYISTKNEAGLHRLAQSHPAFFTTLLFCHDLKESNHETNSNLLGDPMEVALVEMAEKFISHPNQADRIDEVPFDSDRRRLATLYRHGSEQLILYCKGALEALMPLCQHVDGPEGITAIDPSWQDRFLKAESELADAGLRVLAVAYRQVEEPYQRQDLESGLILVGLVGLEDPPRPEVPAAVQKCFTAGIRIIMVTGDHPKTAAGVAKQIGLVQNSHPIVITGQKLLRMSDSQLQLALDHPVVVFARLSADQKLRIVAILQKKGHIVAVTGDGVNDAPALKKADIGIAMGLSGSDVARASADMILLDDNFASIVSAIEEGRAVFANIRKFLSYILTSNIPEIIPYLAFVLFRIPLPLTIMQILAVDLGTDMVPALALGAEKPDPEVMKSPPRPAGERLLTWPLLVRAYLFLGMLEAGAALAGFFFVLIGAGWLYGQEIHPGDNLYPQYLQACTACLAAIVLMQIANVFLCRGDRRSRFSGNPFSNKLIPWGIAVEVMMILFICYTPMGNGIFATGPLPWSVWLFLVLFPPLMIACEEGRKAIVRRWWPIRSQT